MIVDVISGFELVITDELDVDVVDVAWELLVLVLVDGRRSDLISVIELVIVLLGWEVTTGSEVDWRLSLSTLNLRLTGSKLNKI